MWREPDQGPSFGSRRMLFDGMQQYAQGRDGKRAKSEQNSRKMSTVGHLEHGCSQERTLPPVTLGA